MRIWKNKIGPQKAIWYGGMLFFAFTALWTIFWTHGDAWKNLVFSNFTDFCMDFFNHMKYVSQRRPYAVGKSACFPPLAYVVYYFLYHCIPMEAGGNAILMGGIREACIGNGEAGIYFALLMYVIGNMILLLLTLAEGKKGSRGEKLLFILLLIFSPPYLFMWERGNLVILSNIFLLIFLKEKDSHKAWVRELSYLSLAASAGLKLYPAVAGALLLREKRWAEALRTIIYGILLFGIPFFLFGGVEGFLQWKDNILIINAPGAVESQAVSLVNFVNLLETDLHLELTLLKKILPLAAMGLGLISLWGLDREWKRVTLLCILMIACPGWSGQYTVIIMTGPLLLFLDEPEEYKSCKSMETLYAILFVGIFCCLVGKETKYLSLSCLVEAIALYLMFSLMLIEGVGKLLRRVIKQKGKSPLGKI